MRMHAACSVLDRDLKGRVCLVTGANAGLGFEISKGLATRGCTLYMLCRNDERGKAAVERVRHVSDNRDVHLRVCDISSLTAVSALASELDAKHTRLYLLVNNAGIMVRCAPVTCYVRTTFPCIAGDLNFSSCLVPVVELIGTRALRRAYTPRWLRTWCVNLRHVACRA